MYSACRIIDRLDPTQLSYKNLLNNNENITRTNLRETFFRLIFDYLWKNLWELCSKNESNETWIYTYTFITKYYPSEKVLQGMKLIDIKNQIDFMNLVYLIFLNENLSEPKELVLTLFKETKFDQSSICLKLLPKMTDTIYHYLETKHINNSTVLIDLLQWIVTMLKSKSDITKEDISLLLKYLDESKTKLSLSMKQFLFDELINKYMKIKHCYEDKIDLWDRLDVLSLLIDCLTNDKLLENYQIPFHPITLSENKLDLQTRPILFDLYFFYLQRQMPKETLTWKLINKGMVLKLPRIEKRQLIPIAEKVFKQLRDYFRVKMIALLLCESNLHNDEANNMTSILSAIITELLSIDKEATEMNVHLQLFLSTIILKQSWSYLSNLLKSQNIQSINEQWTTTLYDVLHLKQKHNKYLQLSHQIEFTLSPNPTNASIFGKFHQPYEELRIIVETCAKNPNEATQWKNLGDWIQRKVNTDPTELQLREIKVMLLLIIYYNYYCNNQLSLIKTLLKIIEDTLQLSREESIIFRAFIQPEEYLIGYLTENNTNNFEKNYLNNLFELEHEDDFDLSLRHMLVNLLAMILLGGKESFLWTFTFQPLTLQNTYGFGSTSEAFIEATGVHYDCGCILTETGELLRSSNDLTICGLYTPPVYAAYFSTYGAMAWHLLLFDNGVQNLYENILTAKVIDEVAPGCQLEGHTTRAKICHFVCTRLLSTFHFLSLQSNQNDACILLTRCFERMACLTQEQSSWIKTSYKTIEEKYDAEQQYTSLVFYFIYYKLTEYKSYVNQLSLQSSIETNLQKFIDQMPDVLQFTQFKNELYCLTNSESSSLKVLQNILNSLDFLKITKLIYDLSEFYLLLHQTYTQLIERNEFLTITLEQLYNRAQKYYNHSHYQSDQNENKTHRSIIDNGILAVNTYHKFTDGLIRPGACDELQRFATISFDTPVHYLVKNENHDEGDIIMHILSVLGKHHNDLLDLVRKELADNQNQSASALKSLIVELSSKYISILQIANDNTGVISLNDKDCLWIEQLAQLSLVNNDQQYFFPTNSRLTFDFVYVQSQIIRTYLLLCRINYEHIQQKYQCHTKRIQTTNPAATTISDVDDLDLNEEYLIRFSNEQIENEWNHLKDMFLDKLYHGYNLLKQIALMLKSQSDNKSSIHLFEFVQTPDKDNDLVKKLEEYDVKDFQLCYINHVLKLYVEHMNGFQYLFTDSPPLLRTPIDNELNNELNKKLEENINNLDNIEQIQSTIEVITKFLNELKTIEDTLSQQSTQSLTETCEHLAMDNLILQWIPEQIKCENYVSLNIHLIRKRSILQERKLNIEQKETKMWIEDFNTDGLKQKQIHHFHRHLNLQNRAQLLRRQQITTGSNAWTIPNIQRENMNVEDTDLADENIENTRIENTDIDDTNVENTPVEITNVENTNVEDTDTENTSVETINLVNTSIEQTNSENANVKNTDTEMINFESINLINTSIEHESNENTNVESTIIENEEQTRTVDHSNKKLEYLSLMELNIRLVPCLSSPLIEEIHEYRIEVPLESISMNKLPKFTFIHPDGKSITYLWKRENFCDRLENLFLEKKYDHNVYVVVDKDEIFVNFTDGNYRPPHQSIVEYHIIEKNLLIQIRFHFRKQEFDYLISSKCNLSSIIHRFIDHQRLRSLSSNTILCFFDHYGKCLENRTFNNHDGLVDIFVKEETSDSNNLCEITIQYKNNTQKTLFEPTTKWQEINLWLRTLLQMSESSVDNYEFLLKEEQKLIDQNEIISSNINQPIDVIDQNIITKVSFSYETNTYSTNALKSTQISSLLNNQNLFEQLNLTDISADDCTLTLGDTIDQRLLTKDDLQQSLATYSTDDNQSIHFQLLISIQIIKYDDNEQIRIPLTSRNTTIEQLLKLTTKSIEIYKYLALIDTKRILDPNETITNLNKTKFFLVKDNETCLISIEKSKDSKLTHNNDYQNDALSQRFTCFATIADIHQENLIDISHVNLLYANDFIPSNDTQLTTLRTQPPIQFKLMNGNLPIMVTIENTLENKSIQFHCSNSMRIGRLFAIAHQLFDLINDCYQLNYDGNVLDDDTFSLEDFGETQFQFQLTPKTSIQCSVTYFPSTIIIPCEESTLASTVVEQTLKKLHIPTDNINIYKLIPLIDDQVEIDFDMSIEEIQESFFSDSTKIFLEIKKKD